MVLIPVVDTPFSFRPGKHAILPAQKDAQFTWIPYFGTILHAQDEQTTIATIILPVKDKSEAREIANSAQRTTDSAGNLILSFESDGMTYTYKYNNCKDGLVLE